ncbi:MAG: crossover junction endodeoxyribonuclease RuvC [Pyrinomonadaceae bacterium]
MTRVIGIDPGSEKTGWGVIEGSGRSYKLIEHGVVRSSSKVRFAARLLKISNGLEEVIRRLAPDTCAIEETFFSTNVKSALKLGHARGVAMLVAERAGLALHEYSPRLVKQTVVGYGNAEKQQVQEMVRILLSLPRPPEPHDAADALAVAICHLHHAGSNERILLAERLAERGAGRSAQKRSKSISRKRGSVPPGE